MQREPHPPTLDQDPAAEDEDAASVVTRFGTAVGAGVMAAVVASLPAALRIGDGASAKEAAALWVALAALLTPLAIATVGVFRRARAGARLLVGPHVTAAAAAVVWWCVLELGLLSVFGAVLRAKTHHHGLAGVTFAFFAVASGVVVGLLAARGGRMLARFSSTAQKVVLAFATLAVFLALVLVGLRTARSEELSTAAALVDVLALAVASAVGSTQLLARVRPLALVGVPVAAIVVVLGLSTVRAEGAIQEAIEKQAPLHGWLLGTVGPG